MTSVIDREASDMLLDASALEHLGLDVDPFVPSSAPLFEGAGRGSLLIELLHQCSFPGQLLAVVGEEGVGKTALIAALCERLDSSDRAAIVDVPILSDAPYVLAGLEDRLGISAVRKPSGADYRDRMTEVRRRAESSGAGEALFLVIFDNAHHLDRESLELIIELATGGSLGTRLGVLLAGAPELVVRLAHLTRPSLGLRTFSLEPLSAEALKSYLRLRLNAAGFEGIFPFKMEDIERLHSLSEGIPAAVHGPAREMLSALAAPPPEPEPLGLPIPHMAAITVLVAALLLAFFTWNVWDEPEPLVAKDVHPALLPDQPVTEFSVGVEPAAAVSRRAVSTGVQTGSSAGDPQKSNSTSPSRSARAVEVDSAEPALIASPPPSSHSPDPAAREHPLLSRPPQRYTLQVMALGSAAAARDFVSRQPNAAELTVIPAKRGGKTLHIVIAGDYASEQDARRAIAALPSEQREAGPWPRSVATLQTELKEQGAR